jgi:hypothetical protein
MDILPNRGHIQRHRGDIIRIQADCADRVSLLSAVQAESEVKGLNTHSTQSGQNTYSIYRVAQYVPGMIGQGSSRPPPTPRNLTCWRSGLC